MKSNSKAGVFWVAIGFYVGFLFFWTLSHELSDMRAIRYPLYFAWETHIDFQEWALPLYFSLDIAVILFPFIFRSWQEAIASVGTLLVQTAIAAIFFVLVPIDPGYESSGVWGPYFYEYFGVENLSRWNHVPSLHVAYVFTIGWTISMRKSKSMIIPCLLWAVAVSVSTMLVHEHHLICVIGGFILFVATITTVYPYLLRTFHE